MSDIFTDKLHTAKDAKKIKKQNEDNFEYKEVINGERGNILVATPINLQAAQESQGVEKFIDPFQSPLILRQRTSTFSSSSKSPCKSLRSISFGQNQLPVDTNNDELMLDDLDES